jgi:nucleotide-binding universal stress UspA family protein
MDQKDYKVLIPIDFTENSRNVIQYVLVEFGDKLTHLYLLHTYRENTPDSSPLVSLTDILREKSERMMQQELRHIAAMVAPHRIQIVPVSRFNGFVNSIVEVVGEHDIDMVVVPSNGYSYPRLDRREDDPSYLLHKLNKPLLLVPKVAN